MRRILVLVIALASVTNATAVTIQCGDSIHYFLPGPDTPVPVDVQLCDINYSAVILDTVHVDLSLPEQSRVAFDVSGWVTAAYVVERDDTQSCLVELELLMIITDPPVRGGVYVFPAGIHSVDVVVVQGVDYHDSFGVSVHCVSSVSGGVTMECGERFLLPAPPIAERVEFSGQMCGTELAQVYLDTIQVDLSLGGDSWVSIRVSALQITTTAIAGVFLISGDGPSNCLSTLEGHWGVFAMRERFSAGTHRIGLVIARPTNRSDSADVMIACEQADVPIHASTWSRLKGRY